jgi:aspartate ammonia-lyase
MATLLILLHLTIVLAMIFIGAKVGGIPVVDDEHHLVGIVTWLFSPLVGTAHTCSIIAEIARKEKVRPERPLGIVLETNRSVYDIVLEKGLMTHEKLDEALNPANMYVSH